MPNGKEQKGIPIIANIIVGVVIAVVLVLIILILVKTKSSFKPTEITPKEPVTQDNTQENIWDIRYDIDDIVVGREVVVVTEEETEDYIFADSNSRYLTEDEIYALSKEEMRIARNEIYARHGRIFDDEGLSEHFNSKSWYTPLYSAEEFDAMGDEIFNEYEYANKNLITEIEEELGYRQEGNYVL